MNDLNVEPCPVCDSRSSRNTTVRLTYGHINGCPDCRSGILEPRPTQESLAALHGGDEYFDHPYFESRRHLTAEAERAAEARLRSIERVMGPLVGKRIVDVGCDVGLFVEHAAKSRAMDASGVDIFPRVVELGRREGRDLHAGTLDEVAFPDASVDVVTGFDLIEHVDSPRSFLAEVHRILKPGGVVMLETPNYSGLTYLLGRALAKIRPLDNVLAGLQERLWPAFHVQYFTSSSLGKRLVTSQFGVLESGGRELDRSELAIDNPFVKAAVLAVFAGAKLTRLPTVISVLAEKK